MSDAAPSFFRAHLFMCTNKRPPGNPWGSCGEEGAQELADHMRTVFKDMGVMDARVTASGCLGRCDKKPAVVVYPEGVWYTVRTKEDVEEVLTAHIKGGKVVERLKAAP